MASIFSGVSIQLVTSSHVPLIFIKAYGYDCSYVAPDEAALSALATKAATAIQGVAGTRYTTGNSCRALYATTGDSTDYIHAIGKSNYTYTYELRDTGTYGFSLPASQIQATVRETWVGVASMLT
jgi:hypothetical protein